MERLIPATSYLIIAMREKWMNLILDGKKTAEVRRTRPARPCDMPDYLYLYHRGHVHGIAEVASYSIPVTETHWVCKWARETVTGYAAMACLDKDKMYEYLTDGVHREHWRALRPVVYKLGKVKRFQKPVAVPCRPQSWMYATPELLDIINGN